MGKLLGFMEGLDLVFIFNQFIIMLLAYINVCNVIMVGDEGYICVEIILSIDSISLSFNQIVNGVY